MNRLPSLHRSLGWVLGCTLLAGIFLTSLGERRVDLWWQLGEGRSILATHHLPVAAPEAFGLPSQPFVDEYGLYEIALALLDRLGGLSAIHLAFIAVYLAIFLIPLRTARTIRLGLLAAALLALATIFLVNRYEQRPELVGVLLLVILVALLRGARDCTPGLLLRLAVLFAIWTSVHSSYLIGLAALGLWLADRVTFTADARWILRQALLAFAVAAGAVLINPYGLGRILFTFTQESDLGSNLLSREMWPAWDQPPGVRVLMTVTGAVLACVLVSRPRPGRWLLVLAGGLFLLTLGHVRHMSFLAVPFLFLGADRAFTEPAQKRMLPHVLALAAFGVAVLLFDTMAARTGWADLFAGSTLSNRGFAPGLVPATTGAVLCHDAEGSFLGLEAAGTRPLIDSGQGRFDDATKRFYFFTVENPEAFDLALKNLPALADVVVTPPVEAWTLAMIGRPGWYLAASDAHGLLFRRSPAQLRLTLHTPANINYVQAMRLNLFCEQALGENDLVRAFCFDAAIDPPGSLALLDRSVVPAWSEAFFSFARAWIRGLPAGERAAFLQVHPRPANALLRELFLAQTNDRLPPPERSNLERLARVLTLIERNDLPDAKTLFATIPRPVVSPLYYSLRSELDPGALSTASRAERWQDWNAGGPELFEQLAPRLNQRIDDNTEAANPR